MLCVLSVPSFLTTPTRSRRLRCWLLVTGLDAAWPVADVVKQQNIEYGAAYNNYTR